jgi:hypothetical protein
MTASINASTTSGVVVTSDTSGAIAIQNNGTTKLTVNSSGTTIDTLKTSSGVLATQNGMTGIPKAWVNFDSTTGNINGGAGTGSFNVSSITRNGTGDCTINFTTAMANSNYAVTFGAITISGSGNDYRGGMNIYGVYNTGPTTKTTTQLRVAIGYTGAPSSAYDMVECNIIIIGA